MGEGEETLGILAYVDVVPKEITGLIHLMQLKYTMEKSLEEGL